MNETEARTFQNRSSENTVILTMIAEERGCQCVPYEDFFTYKRWQAQGFQVQKGQKGTSLTVYKPRFKEEDGKQIQKGMSRWTAYVFCRCQVKGEQHA